MKGLVKIIVKYCLFVIYIRKSKTLSIWWTKNIYMPNSKQACNWLFTCQFLPGQAWRYLTSQDLSSLKRFKKKFFFALPDAKNNTEHCYQLIKSPKKPVSGTWMLLFGLHKKVWLIKNHNAMITFLSELYLSHQRFIQLVQMVQNFDEEYAHQFHRTYPQNSKTVVEAARLKISSYGMFVGWLQKPSQSV